MEHKPEIIAAGKLEPLNGKGRWLIFLLVLFGLGLTIYGESLHALFGAVLQREGSSHGLFVPFISGYIIWQKLDKIKEIKSQLALVPGGMVVAVSFLISYFCRNNTGFSMAALSFLLVAAGLILLLFGREMFKEVSFPLVFLVTMIPLPTSVYSQLSEWMRQATTWGAVTLIEPLDIPMHRDGYHVYLPKIHLYVAHSCSGIRYLLSYFVFGIFYAFLYRQSSKARLLLVAATVPLSIVGGMVRLWVIFATAYYIGPIMTEDRPHVLLSWSVFMVVLVAAIGLDRYVLRKQKSSKLKDGKLRKWES